MSLQTILCRAIPEAELVGESLLSLQVLAPARAVVDDCPAAQYHADVDATGVYGGLYNWVRHFTDLKNESVQGFPPDSKDPAVFC